MSRGPGYDIRCQCQITVRRLPGHRAGVFDVADEDVPPNVGGAEEMAGTAIVAAEKADRLGRLSPEQSLLWPHIAQSLVAIHGSKPKRLAG